MDNPIVDWAEWGDHIPLRCRCGARGWATKNIGFIGARTVFYFGEGRECLCSINSLRPDREAYNDKQRLRQLVSVKRLRRIAAQDRAG